MRQEDGDQGQGGGGKQVREVHHSLLLLSLQSLHLRQSVSPHDLALSPTETERDQAVRLLSCQTPASPSHWPRDQSPLSVNVPVQEVPG